VPRYLVERTFQEKFGLPAPSDSEQARRRFIENNSLLGAVWIHSYVSPDRKKAYCIYDAPTPEAVRRAAMRNGLPVDRITEVRLLDPFFV
jgi:hypothetical protein